MATVNELIDLIRDSRLLVEASSGVEDAASDAERADLLTLLWAAESAADAAREQAHVAGWYLDLWKQALDELRDGSAARIEDMARFLSAQAPLFKCSRGCSFPPPPPSECGVHRTPVVRA